MDLLINQFKQYQVSHPNLSDCWIAYLELKKRHYSEILALQAAHVLEAIKNGYADLNKRDIIRLFLYKEVMLK